jgi:hypothetical protein
MPYSIEARSLEIFGVASHDFWVLRDERGKAVAELHGLATDRRTGEAIPIGTDESRHSLRAWHFAHDEGIAARTGNPVSRMSYVQEGQRYRTVLSGPESEVMARWSAAVKATAPLNALDLDYPNLGFRMDGSTVNSNSAYRTLGEVMGLPVRDFPGVVEPGLENRMMSPAQIEEMRAKGLPVLDAPSRREGDRYVPLPNDGLSRPRLPPDGLLGQTAAAVGRLDAQLGRGSDEASDRLAVNLAALASREGLHRVDHVVLGIGTDRLRAGENVFVVQGELRSPTNRVAHMRSDDALSPPSADTIAIALAAERTSDAPAHDRDIAQQTPAKPRLHHA